MIDENAKMTAAAGRYAGLDRFEARNQVVAELERLGLMQRCAADNTRAALAIGIHVNNQISIAWATAIHTSSACTRASRS